MHNAAKTYFQTQFSTMGQGELLLLLYDGALKFLNQAKEKIEQKDYGAKGIAISKALDIIAELDSTLNPEAGGELVENLHQLYFICSMRLLKANLKMDLELIDSVIAVLIGLRSAYAEIMHTPEAQAASQQISSKQKYYNVKGRTPAAAESVPPAAVGGGRAQQAYTAVARQTAPVEPQPLAPTTPQPQPASGAGVSPVPTSVNRTATAAYGRASQYRS